MEGLHLFKIHNLILLHVPKILLPFPTWHVNYYVCFVYDWKDELVMYDLSSYSVSVKMKKECDIAFVIISNKMRKPFRDNHYHFYLQVLQTSILTITRRTYEFFSTKCLFVLLKLTRSWKNSILWLANIACKSSMGMNLEHEYL